jgi:hypothetical protein
MVAETMMNSGDQGAADVGRRSDARGGTRFWALLLGVSSPICALATACSDEFDSCYSTHTCPRPANDGGMGGTDDAPEGAGGEGGTSGSAGTKLTDGGADSMDLHLVVESTTPLDQAEGVERDISVEVVFSATIDATTVSDDSFKVTGPNGVVEGRLATDADKVTFSPSRPWSLHTDYNVAIADIAGVDGTRLQSVARFAFTVRDGVFQKPERLWNAKAQNLKLVGSASGHVAASWGDSLTPGSTIVALYDPGSGWGKPGAVEADTQTTYTSGCVALNSKGEAFAMVGSDQSSYLWSRAVRGAWSLPTPSSLARGESCALADDGTAMAVWTAGESQLAAELSPEGEWSEVSTVQGGARSYRVIRYESGFLALHALEAGGLYSSVFDPEQGWLTAKPVTPPGLDFNYYSLAAHGSTALWTWYGSNGRMHASVFDGKSWTTQDLGPLVAEGTTASVGEHGSLAAWNHQGTAYAALYDVEEGWGDPVKLGATNSIDFGPAATIDGSGNSLAAWIDGGSISWRRAAHATGDWSEPQQIEDQDPGMVHSATSDAGEVMLVWQNPLGIWASRFE